MRDPCVLLMINFVWGWTLYGTKCYDWIIVICGNERVTSFANERDSVLVTSFQCRVRRAVNLHPISFLELLIWKRVIFSDLKIVSRQWYAVNKTTKCIHSCGFLWGLRELVSRTYMIHFCITKRLILRSLLIHLLLLYIIAHLYNRHYKIWRL